MTADPTDGGLVGQVIENLYQVEKRLDRGGMGTVYLARHLRLGNVVVVKVPASDPSGTRNERLEAEIDQLTELQHPHIVRVRDKVHVDGVPCAVLDYLPRGNLKERIRDREGRFTVAETLAWLVPIADALDHLHVRGIVHRDVKPGNIVFDDADQAMLVDFGIAKVTGEAGMTDTGLFPGSPQYMAPELDPSPAYDQFALATVVYECLGGQLPWTDHHHGRLVLRKGREAPPRLDSLGPGIPRSLADCVHRALAPDPALRFPTCSDFAREAASHAGAPARPARRRPGWIGPVLALGLVGAAVVAWQLRPTTPEATPVVATSETASARATLFAATPSVDGVRLAVTQRTFGPGETPTTDRTLVTGQPIGIYARAVDTALPYLLILALDAEDAITIVYPEAGTDPRPLANHWRRVAQFELAEGGNAFTAVAIAADGDWAPVLERHAPPPPGAFSGEAWVARDEDARTLAEGISRALDKSMWSRAVEQVRTVTP